MVIFDAVVCSCVVLDCVMQAVPDILSTSFLPWAVSGKPWISALLSVSYECDTVTCSEALRSRLDV